MNSPTQNLQEAPKKKKGVALAGVSAGSTSICTVGHTGNDLHYRGYDIIELAKIARAKVFEKFQIKLEAEVQLVGLDLN